MRPLFAVLRILVALAVVAAIVGQLITSIGFWRSNGVDDLTVNIANFFSFFTVDANVLTVLVMLAGAWLLLARTGEHPQWFQVSRLSLVTYMGTTGIVYNLLLRGIELPQGSTLAWSNEVLHVVAPLYVVLDWLFAPGRRPAAYRWVWVVVIFPIVWVIYTLIRGPLVSDPIYGQPYWYPYPFLNPNIAPEGYLSVAFYVLLISAVIAIVALGAVWISRRFAPRST